MLVSFELAVRIAKKLLAGQGFGAGAGVRSSGETGVFKLIEADAPILFDVGGHVGEYTEAFLTAFPRGRSYVFEPSASHVDLLRRRLGDRQGVQIFSLGHGAEPAGCLSIKIATCGAWHRSASAGSITSMY